ncbi:MAG: ArdC-like ssDNA-binding domain-containing protein [Burkholderiales bacterium]
MLKHLYSRVTARIVEDLEKGVRPWMKPWSAPTLKAAFFSLPA